MTPAAIRRQNYRYTALDGCGLPGERIAGRNARSARHCRRIPSGTSLIFMLQSLVTILEHLSHLKVLRRPAESALRATVAVMD